MKSAQLSIQLPTYMSACLLISVNYQDIGGYMHPETDKSAYLTNSFFIIYFIQQFVYQCLINNFNLSALRLSSNAL